MTPAQSQVKQSARFYPVDVVSDVNVISSLLAKDSLNNNDIITISAVSCGAIRVAKLDSLPSNFDVLIKDNGYPDRQQLNSLSIEEFINFEEDWLRRFGAADATVALLESSVAKSPQFPNDINVGLFSEWITVLERVSCDVRARKPSNSDAVAGDREKKYAETLGMAVFGIAVIVVDGFVVVETGGLGTSVIGMASGGWGWNRVEEAFPIIMELWESLFN
ncbi:hypothetical protein [Oceanibaculum sp.]|uniref:hypothetical protein n=1 Tax=Oceanibaculum sp. TaxID=1903597 RepID=UPI00259067AF|nr:hypothetical protein [Oceanibaculum sp.]MCH2395198.1 hypothetical protein [Oceanibaculum sp.]